MGSPSQVRTSFSRGAAWDSLVVIQRKPNCVRVLGRGAHSKNKRQSPPANSSGSSTNVPATRSERRTEAAQSTCTQDNVAISRVNHHQLLLGNWNILPLTGKELKLVEKAKRYHLDVIGVSSTKKRGSGTVDLDAKSSILVLIPVFLLKRVSGFSQAPACQTVCQMGFL